MARHLGDVRKIVVSRGQLEFTWRNSEQLAGDLVEGVTAPTGGYEDARETPPAGLTANGSHASRRSEAGIECSLRRDAVEART